MRGSTTTRMRGGQGRHVGVALAALACVLIVTACGGSGSGSGAATGRYGPASSPAALSRCMRANGLSGFPDPTAGPGGGVGLPLVLNSDGSLTAEGQTFAGPALHSAERACRAYLPPAGGPPRVSADQRRKALAFARCMRAHGVPNFPDPDFSPSGGQVGLPGINPQAPAVRSAARVCGGGGAGNIEVAG